MLNLNFKPPSLRSSRQGDESFQYKIAIIGKRSWLVYALWLEDSSSNGPVSRNVQGASNFVRTFQRPTIFRRIFQNLQDWLNMLTSRYVFALPSKIYIKIV